MTASIPTNPSAGRRWLLLLLAVIVLVKVFHFAIAFRALHAGVDDPHFATGQPLVAWDSVHYLEIMNHGYPDRVGDDFPETIGFFPLLPLLTRPLAAFMDGPAAMLIVCNVASIAGVLFFFHWCRRTVGPCKAFLACMLLLSYPPAMFFSAAYTEPLFCATTAAALYFADCRRPWLAALAAGLGSATRPTGVAVSFVIWVESIVRTAPRDRLRSAGKFIALGLLSASGIIGYATYLTYRYGTPMAYIRAQQHFVPAAANASAAPPAAAIAANAATVATVAGSPATEEAAPQGIAAKIKSKLRSIGAWGTLLAYLTFGLSVLILIPRLPWPRHILLIPLLIFLVGFLPNHGARINSCSRFMTCALPLFAALVMLPWIRNRSCWLFAILFALGFMVQAMFVGGFTRGIWAG